MQKSSNLYFCTVFTKLMWWILFYFFKRVVSLNKPPYKTEDRGLFSSMVTHYKRAPPPLTNLRKELLLSKKLFQNWYHSSYVLSSKNNMLSGIFYKTIGLIPPQHSSIHRRVFSLSASVHCVLHEQVAEHYLCTSLKTNHLASKFLKIFQGRTLPFHPEGMHQGLQVAPLIPQKLSYVRPCFHPLYFLPHLSHILHLRHSKYYNLICKFIQLKYSTINSYSSVND